MRKYLALITDDEDDGELVGRVETRESPFTATKNEEVAVQQRNLETGETWQRRYVGLGYIDTKTELSPQEWISVLNEKLVEIDEKYLDKAGVELGGGE